MSRFGFALRHSLWLLAVVLGFGFLSWTGFVYVAVRTRRPRFVIGAVVVTVVCLFAWYKLATADAHSFRDSILWFLAWMFSMIYGFSLNNGYIRWHRHREDTPNPAAESFLAPPPPVLQRLDHLSTQVAVDPALTPQIREAYGRLEARLRDLLLRSAQLASNPEGAHLVERIVVDYLPTSLGTFSGLPSEFAAKAPAPHVLSPHDELVAQLELLEREAVEIADATYAGDATRLQAQGRFLRDRFHTSALDLD